MRRWSPGAWASPASAAARPCCIDYNAKLFRVGAVEVKEGDLISIDGATGSVILGEVKMIAPELSDEFRILLDWADEIRRLGVRANADTPLDAERSRQFGAEGIGLCRTEHMFMASDRLPIVHEMIMSETIEERTVALDKLLPMQQGDFYGILKAMDGLPVTIRLLDPPLHEFLPNTEELAVEIAKLRLTDGDPGEIERKETIRERPANFTSSTRCSATVAAGSVSPIRRSTPCRCGRSSRPPPSCCNEGYHPEPEIMIPVVMSAIEFKLLRTQCEEVLRSVEQEAGVHLEYLHRHDDRAAAGLRHRR